MSDSVKRICHITTVHPRKDIRIFFKECASLSAVYDVSLIVADGKGSDTDGKVRIIDIYKGERSRINRILFISYKAYKMAMAVNCEVYHFHDPEFLFYGLLLKFRGKKVIYDVHEDLPDQVMSKGYINPFFRKPLSKLVSFIEKKISQKLTAVITVTPEINKRFIKNNQNSFIINNWPRLEEMDLSDPVPKEKNEICYIGNITKVRGLGELVDSLEKIDVSLNLAGNFESEEFRNFLINKPGWKKVMYYGFLSRRDTFQIISKSIAGIVTFYPEPNHLTAQPTKMFEYMLAGIPVIASDFPKWKEFLNLYNCGISVNPKDPDAISKAIMSLINNPEIAHKMGENGKRAIKESFSWKTEETKLLDIYSNILSAN
jgi:glycosyltransferase involved in cell wall biosynthesis